VCRSQRALLQVLSKVDDESCRSDDLTRRSTAWIRDSEDDAVGRSNSASEAAVSSSRSVAAVRNNAVRNSAVRNSTSARSSKSGSTAGKQSVNTDAESHRGPRRSAHHPSPDDDTSRSTRTNVTSSQSQAVRQSRSGRSHRRPITVQVELLSNWGHERLVGLTEIELLDVNDDRIDIDPATDVTVSAAAPVSDVDALFNGKCKVCPL